MALKDLLALVDAKLKDAYDHIAYDVSSDRERMVKRIEDTKSKYLATEPARGRKDYTVKNNVVAYTPTMRGGGIVKIDGQTVSYIPAERFGDFLDLFRAEVSEGRMDKEVEAAASSGTSTISSNMDTKVRGTAITKPRKMREPGTTAGWSDERRAKFAATVAARRSAKGE